MLFDVWEVGRFAADATVGPPRIVVRGLRELSVVVVRVGFLFSSPVLLVLVDVGGRL